MSKDVACKLGAEWAREWLRTFGEWIEFDSSVSARWVMGGNRAPLEMVSTGGHGRSRDLINRFREQTNSVVLVEIVVRSPSLRWHRNDTISQKSTSMTRNRSIRNLNCLILLIRDLDVFSLSPFVHIHFSHHIPWHSFPLSRHFNFLSINYSDHLDILI